MAEETEDVRTQVKKNKTMFLVEEALKYQTNRSVT